MFLGGNPPLPRSALDKPHQINTTSGSQPCDTFAVHPSLEYVRHLYEQGDASFLANIGSLIDPVDRVSYFDGSKRIPPQVFAHNMGQKAAQNVHPQDGASKGVLGRMLDAIAAQSEGHRVSAYSIAGNAKIVDAASVAPDIISWRSGVVRLANFEGLKRLGICPRFLLW